MTERVPAGLCFLNDSEVQNLDYSSFEEYLEGEYGEDYAEEMAAEKARLEESYDFDRSNYELVSEFTAAEKDGWDYFPAKKRVVRRKSDDKYFMLTEHAESWYGGCLIHPGEYGDISEAKEVMVPTFERV